MKQTFAFLFLLLLAATAIGQPPNIEHRAAVSDELGTLKFIRKENNNRVITTYTNHQSCTVDVTVGFAENRVSHAVKPGEERYFILQAYTYLKIQAKAGWNCAANNDKCGVLEIDLSSALPLKSITLNSTKRIGDKLAVTFTLSDGFQFEKFRFQVSDDGVTWRFIDVPMPPNAEAGNTYTVTVPITKK